MHYDLSKIIDFRKLDVQEVLRRATDQDNPDPSALFLGAIILRDGYDITPVDMDLSFEWAQRGADLGDPLCTALYASYLHKGVGGKKTPIHITRAEVSKILQPLQDQAKAGGPYALSMAAVVYHYGLATPPTPATTVEYMQQAIALGEPDAAANLGTFYHLGHGGLTADRQQAIHWLTLAANQGNASAQEQLGILYIEIPGTETEGLAWLEKAANQNRVQSQSLLGHWYLGETVGSTVNYDLAIKWLSEAAKNNHTESTVKLAKLYEEGRGGKLNPALAYQYYIKALSYETDKRYFTNPLSKHDRKDIAKTVARLKSRATVTKEEGTGDTLLEWPNCDHIVREKPAPAPNRPATGKPKRPKGRHRGNGDGG